MLTEFSAGYYVGRFDIESYEGDHAVMDRDRHEAANERVYAAGEGLERLDYPLVAKVETSHVPVFSADDVPPDALGLPADVLDAMRIDPPHPRKAVLVAKAHRARRLVEWATPYTIHSPDFA